MARLTLFVTPLTENALYACVASIVKLILFFEAELRGVDETTAAERSRFVAVIITYPDPPSNAFKLMKKLSVVEFPILVDPGLWVIC